MFQFGLTSLLYSVQLKKQKPKHATTTNKKEEKTHKQTNPKTTQTKNPQTNKKPKPNK